MSQVWQGRASWVRIGATGVMLIGLVVVSGCGSSSSTTGSSGTIGGLESSASPASTSSSSSQAEPTDQSESESALEPVSGLKLSGSTGHKAAAEEVCARLSAKELERILPTPSNRFEQQVQIQPEPGPTHPLPHITVYGCGYEDQFKELWLSDGFTKSPDSVEENVNREVRTEGDREWVPVEISGFKGYYTPGLSSGGVGTTELLLQIEDGLNFAVRPYSGVGIPGLSTPGMQAPTWVQKATEELAEAILS